MAKTGHFDIVGHLDLLKVFGFFPKQDIRILAKNALLAIKKANMSIELNVSGWRKPVKEAYPSASLLEVISELEIPITFGSDAHRPDQVGMFSDEIEALARSFGYSHCATYRNRDRELIKF
jgi:histidinol-phosphatase (PHP family)